MEIPIYQVDAFTAVPFSGNPAAVCILTSKFNEAWMQRVASEMNLSETAFVIPEGDGYHLRWFTPTTEVKLCGHATLASAFVLFEREYIASEKVIKFLTSSGLLTSQKSGEWIWMNFPRFEVVDIKPPPGLMDALGLTATNVLKSGENILVEVKSEEEVKGCNPDFGQLIKLPLQGVAITARSARPEYDFVSRYFAPWVGIDEDPVTGSAHCCLGPYWGARINKEEMTAYQVSSRGGIVKMILDKDRVKLGGQAVMILEGMVLA
jgi:PhzF family phenazine biosynthesis protein